MRPTTLEEQVRGLHEEGHSIRGIAYELSIDKSKVQRILRRPHEPLDTEDETAFDTAADTAVSASDTPGDTGKKPEKEERHGLKQPVSPAKTYTLADAKLLMKQVGLLKEDINEFISEMVDSHTGVSSVWLSAYRSTARRTQRLIQSTVFLADRLEEDHRDLLVMQALESILATTRHVLATGECSENSKGEVWLEIPRQDTQLWQECREADFFHPSI